MRNETTTLPNSVSRASLHYEIQSFMSEQVADPAVAELHGTLERRRSPKKKSAEHAPTMQLAKPDFLNQPGKINIQRKPYSTSGPSHYNHGESSTNPEGWVSVIFILVQIVLMVVLGAFFAYFVIRYVLA